jgi:hypothetical protein
MIVGLMSSLVVAQETKKTPKKAPKKETVKVYTNADVKKYAEPETKADAKPSATPEGTEQKAEKPEPKKTVDSLTWLRQRQDAQREHAKAVSEAEAALATAKQQLANLERQLLAARNPFAARPELSDEEKSKRKDSGESAAQRHERTKELVEKSREAVRAAESELARLRAQRP